MNWKVLVGSGLIAASLVLFIFDLARMGLLILQVFALLNIISPFLSGKKIASYMHDFRKVQQMGAKTSPMLFVYLWLFVWLVFFLIYLFLSMAFSYAIKYIVSTMRADYLGMVYSILMLVGGYYFFIGRYSQSSKFITRWGRAVEKGERLKNSQLKSVSGLKSFEKYL